MSSSRQSFLPSTEPQHAHLFNANMSKTLPDSQPILPSSQQVGDRWDEPKPRISRYKAQIQKRKFSRFFLLRETACVGEFPSWIGWCLVGRMQEGPARSTGH